MTCLKLFPHRYLRHVKCVLIDGHLLTWRESFIYRCLKGVRLIGYMFCQNFPIPHKSLRMPMYKGIERWGTLDKIPHTFPTGSPPYLSKCSVWFETICRNFPVRGYYFKKGECMGNMWGTSKRVPHAGTPVNKGIGGMWGLFWNIQLIQTRLQLIQRCIQLSQRWLQLSRVHISCITKMEKVGSLNDPLWDAIGCHRDWH